MDANIYDLVKEKTTTTGTGLNIALAALTGFARFSDVAAVDEAVYYVIRDGSNAEVGIGTVKAGNTLDRTTPLITLDSGVYDDTTPTRISLSGNAVVAIAPTAVALLDGLDDKPDVAGNNVFTKAQRGNVTTLTDGATITPNFNDSNFYTVTINGSRTLANPTSLTAGQSGVIYVTKTNAGDSLAYGTYWPSTLGDFAAMSVGQTGAIYYSVIDSTHIDASTKYPVGP